MRIGYRARVERVALLLAVVWLIFGLQHLVMGHVRTVLLDAILAIVCIAGWHAAERVKTPKLVAHIVTLGSIAGIVMASLLSGQSRALAPWLLISFPLLGAYLGGTARATRLGIIALLGVVAVHFSEAFGQTIPEHLPSGAQALLVQLGSLALCLAGVHLLSRRHQREVEEERERTRRAQAEAASLLRDRDRDRRRHREASQAARAKARFLSSLSHELRTPLGSVLGMTELLEETELGLDQVQLVSSIARSGGSLLRAVNEVDEFTALTIDELTVESAPFDLHVTLDDALGVFGHEAWRRGLALSWGGDAPRFIRADEKRVAQLLSHLIGNAIESTTEGGVTVSASRHGDGIRLIVEDTGAGFTPEELHELFDPERSGRRRLGLAITQRITTALGGKISVTSKVGVGSRFLVSLPATMDPTAPEPAPETLRDRRVLCVEPEVGGRERIRRILRHAEMTVLFADNEQSALEVAESGIDLLLISARHPRLSAIRDTVESVSRARCFLIGASRSSEVLAAGHRRQTEATLLYPITEAAFLAAARSIFSDTTPPKPSGGALAARHPLSILVAEDDEVNRKVIVSTLSRLGYHPEVVTNGLEAIAATADHAFDLILMDVRMPVMTGVDATRRIRTRGKHQPQIIALTAGVSEEERETALKSGMNDFIEKPVRFEKLVAALERASSQSQAMPLHVLASASADEPLQQLRILCSKNPEEFERIIAGHLSTSSALFNTILTAIDRDDSGTLMTASHNLKNACAMFGLDEVGALTDALESMGRRGEVTKAKHQVPALRRAMESCQQKLREEVERFFEDHASH